jgi:hypothetical protein
MKTTLLFATLILGLTTIYGQTEPLDQLNNNKKKDGKWIVYLDSQWNKVDKSNAVFYRYTWFDNGVNINPMGAGGGKNSKMETTNTSTDKVKMLDGEYKWFKDGKLKYVHVLKNGAYVSYKEYKATGELESMFDYIKGCEGQPHSWTLYVYDKTGKVISTTTICKDKKGKWPKMRG